jgi:CBS domain-containing protein
MKVKDVMTAAVVTVDADTALKDAAHLFVEHHITGVPVVDASGEVVGVLSEADIVAKEAKQRHHKRSALAWLLDPVDPWLDDRAGARTVREAMSSPALTIGPNAEVSEAAARMVEDGVNRLPVIEDGTLIGIVTRADLVRAFTRPDDEIHREIVHDVVERVFWLDPAEVVVVVNHGAVVLSGRVETESDVKLLPELVQRVPGVVSVSAALSAKQVMVGK